jgi:hypothetical protein
LKRERTGRKHLVIPDVQCRPGVDLRHLTWIGKYIVSKLPDVVVCIGDFSDMNSLSLYDRGKRSFEGRTYAKDIAVAKKAMGLLLAPLRAYQKTKEGRSYKPRLVMTLGNHEERINRAIDDDSRLHGTISIDDLGYKEAGWQVYPFLKVVVIDGVAYSHYFVSGVMNKPVSSASALVKKMHQSATMGHVQKTDIFMGDAKADGTPIVGLFCGTAYLHKEKYLGAQGNAQRRQVILKHDVKNGAYDPVFCSLAHLRRRYAA